MRIKDTDTFSDLSKEDKDALDTWAHYCKHMNVMKEMKNEIFDFSEALRRMKEGKKVRRIGWGIVDKLWIDKDRNINIFYKATTHSSEGFIHIFPSCWSYFTCEDILATDWEEVE